MHRHILKIIAVLMSIYGLMLFAACTPVGYESPPPSEPSSSAFPDLRVTITGPASAEAGSDIGPQLTVQVRNDGNDIAFGTQSTGSNGYMVDVVLSRDTLVPEGWASYDESYHEDVLLKGGRISNTTDLPPRQSRRYEVGGGIPADTPPGVYFICARVDAGNTVSELHEGNNAACTRIRITAPVIEEPPQPTRLPDLRVAITAPASAEAGSDIGPQLTVQVRNDGNDIAFGTQSTGSNGYMVDVVLSRDTLVPEGWASYDESYHEDVLLKGGRISNTADLSPRQSRRYEVGGGIPADTPPGVYFICARVDAGNSVSELHEGNNAACRRIRITAPVSQEPTEVPTKEDCVSFNPQTARVAQIRGSWKIIDGRHWLFDFGQKRPEAEQALRIIKHYGMNQSCFVGRPRPSFQYLLVSGNAPEGGMPGEDCVAFNPQRTTVQRINDRWKIVDGRQWLFDFGANKDEAMMALEIIKRYGFTHSCFVGRPNASFTYLRKGPQEQVAFPDLRVTITGPASAEAGSDIGPQLTVQVRNDGNDIAFGTQSTGSNGYMVDVVLSRDTLVPEGWASYDESYHEDVLLKGGRISNTTDLPPRQSRRYEVGGGIPADTPPGVYFICARVDAGNTVSELQEDNNAACTRIRITAPSTDEPPFVLPPGFPPGLPPGLPTEQPTEEPTEVPTKEDCVSFNPQTARVAQIRGSWKIIDGRHWLFDFGQKRPEAEQALRIIKHYGMNQSCFVGRPRPSFQYLLVSGNAPEGGMPGEDCVAFDPQWVSVVQIKGSWKIVDGRHWLFDFGANKDEAMMALEIIKRYGFTHSCFVGRPNASFTYLRK